MGQLQNRELIPDEQFNENSNNGFILGGKYIPEEIIADILLRVDIKTLLKCQLVCVSWKELIQNYIWRKRAEMTLSRPYIFSTELSWKVYYMIAKKKPFERNLIKNHSGQYGVKKHWKILSQGGDCWKVENPCVGVPSLPNDPVFEGQNYCFVTSYSTCSKVQIINLEKEGLTTDILDVLQPPIMISEWYSCRWDCPAIYDLSVKLLANDVTVLDAFQFREKIEGERQNKWFKVCHTFKNYGRGLRKITFSHGGIDRSFWAGHYGSKMAGACVCIQVPESERSDIEKCDNSEKTI